MCGICGFASKIDRPAEVSVLKDMIAAIRHRGPDAEGVYTSGKFGFGHARLSILDLSAAANQPMVDTEGKLVIVFNGEIYNFRELREELRTYGFSFQTTSDTEVILKGFRAWGANVFERLNGMFAIALFDEAEERLFLARDRFGVKPLYVYFNEEQLIFSSEVKGILRHPSYRFDINYDALNEYFTFQNIFRFGTLFKGVQMLAPARVLEFDRYLNKKEWSYWDYDFSNTDDSIDENVAIEETLRLFKEAVKRQMVADVDVGSYLSGGMDSGSITAIASSYVRRLRTFTCGFDMSSTTGREANFDERRDAEIMASLFKTEHYEQVLNSSDLSWAVPKLVWHLEDLRVGMSYPNFYIAGLASKFVKVCLSGAGGDELYGGYPWRYYRVSSSINQEKYFREYYSFWQRLVNDEEKSEFFTPEIYKATSSGRNAYDIFRNVFLYNDTLKYNNQEDHIKNSLYFEAKTFLPALFVVGDKLAMAHSLEERFPFMDNDLVNFAQKIPVRYKLGRMQEMARIDENEIGKLRKFEMEFNDGKNVLRKAMAEIIPDQIINRKKQGFSAPDESWYRGENFEYVSRLIGGKKSRINDFIQPSFIRKTLEEHQQHKVNHRLLIWSFICFEWWIRLFVDGEKPEDYEMADHRC